MMPALKVTRELLQGQENMSYGRVRTMDEIYLNYFYFKPQKPVQSCMVFLHGGGAHSLAGYPILAKNLLEMCNISTLLFDIRGHGQSGGIRGDADTPERVWEDINDMIALAKAKHPDLPIYLGGHSSGAGLILNYHASSYRQPVDRYIFLAPELGFRANLGRIDPLRKPFVTASPQYFILNSLSHGFFAGNWQAIRFDYSEEMVTHEGFLPGYTVNMARAVTPYDSAAILKTIDVPTYIAIGNEDELIDADKMLAYLSPMITGSPHLRFNIIQHNSHLSILSEKVDYLKQYLDEEKNVVSPDDLEMARL